MYQSKSAIEGLGSLQSLKQSFILKINPDLFPDFAMKLLLLSTTLSLVCSESPFGNTRSIALDEFHPAYANRIVRNDSANEFDFDQAALHPEDKGYLQELENFYKTKFERNANKLPPQGTVSKIPWPSR